MCVHACDRVCMYVNNFGSKQLFASPFGCKFKEPSEGEAWNPQVHLPPNRRREWMLHVILCFALLCSVCKVSLVLPLRNLSRQAHPSFMISTREVLSNSRINITLTLGRRWGPESTESFMVHHSGRTFTVTEVSASSSASAELTLG